MKLLYTIWSLQCHSCCLPFWSSWGDTLVLSLVTL